MAKNWFETIKDYYKRGLWNAQQVQKMVELNVITQEQATEILNTLSF